MPTRLVTFAGSTVAIDYTGPEAANIVDFLYRHVPADPRIPPSVTYRLLEDEPAGPIHLYQADRFVYANKSPAMMAEILLSQSCHDLADRSQGGLLFHAAGLADSTGSASRGLILPGTMNSGKTTLTAWLLARGLVYLTDEMVFVPTGSSTFQALTRPLNLKYLSRPIWQRLANLSGRPDLVLSGQHNDLVQPQLFNPGPVLAEAELRLIIFPRFRPDGEFKLEPLSRGQAALALMECLVNARNLPDHGLSEVARLAGLAPAYRLAYGSFGQLSDGIERLWPKD